MSGIYIKGMEMPSEEYGAMTITLYPNGHVVEYLGDIGRDFGNAIPVPDHGRLIEETDAIETAWMILRGLGYLKEESQQLEQTVREVFATAPAIEVE